MIIRLWSCLCGVVVSIAVGYLSILALRLNWRAARGGSPWLDGYMPRERQSSMVYWAGVALSVLFFTLACSLGILYASTVFNIVIGH